MHEQMYLYHVGWQEWESNRLLYSSINYITLKVYKHIPNCHHTCIVSIVSNISYILVTELCLHDSRFNDVYCSFGTYACMFEPSCFRSVIGK